MWRRERPNLTRPHPRASRTPTVRDSRHGSQRHTTASPSPRRLGARATDHHDPCGAATPSRSTSKATANGCHASWKSKNPHPHSNPLPPAGQDTGLGPELAMGGGGRSPLRLLGHIRVHQIVSSWNTRPVQNHRVQRNIATPTNRNVSIAHRADRPLTFCSPSRVSITMHPANADFRVGSSSSLHSGFDKPISRSLDRRLPVFDAFLGRGVSLCHASLPPQSDPYLPTGQDTGPVPKLATCGNGR